MADFNLDKIGPLKGPGPSEMPQPSEERKRTEGPTFGETLNGLIGDVDDLQKNAEESTRRMLTGEIEDVHQVMVAMEEAQTSFQMMMEIRNKIITAYQEVMRMQV